MDGPDGVYAVQPDGSNAHKIVDFGASASQYPRWSPGGDRIACEVPGGGIRVFKTDGSTSWADSYVDDGHHPSWSPDGSQIAREMDGSIYVGNADGSGNRLVAQHGYEDYRDPDWSPDGSQIVFATEYGDLYVVLTDGSGLRRVTSGSACDFWPAWSPDGSKIAFSRRKSGEGKFGLWVMDGEGNGAVRLTPRDDVERYNPDWSPDGTQIAFGAYWSDDWAIRAINADGSGERTVVEHMGFQPSWSRGPVQLDIVVRGR
jgi:Tol biopolymer transport system component